MNALSANYYLRHLISVIYCIKYTKYCQETVLSANMISDIEMSKISEYLAGLRKRVSL